MPVVDLSHPLEQISERGLLPKRPFPGPADLPLVGGAFYLGGHKGRHSSVRIIPDVAATSTAPHAVG